MGECFSIRRGQFRRGPVLKWPGRAARSLSAPVGLLLVAAVMCAGCQSARPIPSRQLIEHQAVIDFSGLKPPEARESLKSVGAVPRTWEQVGPIKNTLYTHTQWRSPSGRTAIGAAYIHMPLPLNADMLLFIAKLEYAKRKNDGRIASRWTDALGREWFEAENDKYHVQGYALAQGFDGWFVYFGYKVTEPPDMSEISLAARSADSFVPTIASSAGSPETAPSTRTAGSPAASQPSTQPSKHGLFNLFHRATGEPGRAAPDGLQTRLTP
jgi:hypothetical protein